MQHDVTDCNWLVQHCEIFTVSELSPEGHEAQPTKVQPSWRGPPPMLNEDSHSIL